MVIDKQVIARIVRQTRSLTLPHHGNVEFKDKGGYRNDLVTELDVKVEEFLREELGKVYPDVAFVGEETGGDRTSDKLWLCDPIDGTAHFVRGLPFCTTMLAYIENGRVMASIIYDFVNDAVYSAVRGQGAFRNEERIRVSDRPLAKAYLGWETHVNKEENLRVHLRLQDQASFFKTITAGYEFTLVASGKIEGRISFDPYGKDYDFAAGSLLVEEAGGVVANLGKTDYDYRNLNFIAANPQTYKALTEGEEAIFPNA